MLATVSFAESAFDNAKVQQFSFASWSISTSFTTIWPPSALSRQVAKNSFTTLSIVHFLEVDENTDALILARYSRAVALTFPTIVRSAGVSLAPAIAATIALAGVKKISCLSFVSLAELSVPTTAPFS